MIHSIKNQLKTSKIDEGALSPPYKNQKIPPYNLICASITGGFINYCN